MKPMTEDDWEAESDAHALEQAEMIRSDLPRFSKAITAAKIIAERKAKEKEAMEKVANAKMVYDNSPDMDGKKKKK